MALKLYASEATQMNAQVRMPDRFKRQRYFWANAHSGTLAGWYYEAREGVGGPFQSRALAEAALQALITEHPQRRAI